MSGAVPPSFDARVTVVIPCFQQAQYLSDAIASLVAQDYDDWQATIVNDGSTDDTVSVAQALIAAHPDRRITLINQANSGPSAARNAAISVTQSEFILPLDADDKIAPSMIGKCVRLLESRPDLAIAYCDWQYFGAQSHVRHAPEYDVQTLCHRENLFTCTSLFRRCAWEAVGGFNLNMRMGLEDWDFWVACAEGGYVGKRIPEVLFYYRAKEAGRNTTVRPHLRRMYAQIVVNHAGLYPPSAVANARAVIAAAEHAAGETVDSIDPREAAARSLDVARENLAKGNHGGALEALKRAVGYSRDPAIAREALLIMEKMKSRSAAPAVPRVSDPNQSELQEVLQLYRSEPRHPGHAHRLVRCFDHLGSVGEIARRNGIDPFQQPKVQKLFSLWFEAKVGLDFWLSSKLVADPQNSLFGFALQCARTAPSDLPFLRPVKDFPTALRIPYIRYLFSLRETVCTAAERAREVAHAVRACRELTLFLDAVVAAPEFAEIAKAVSSAVNFIPLYCSSEDLLPAYRARAEVIERVAAVFGTKLDSRFPRRRNDANGRLRVGILCHHLGPQTETFVTLSNFRLDPSKFELHAFVIVAKKSATEDCARGRCSSFTVLYGDIRQQVERVRAADLDALIVATNITAVTNHISLLAAHRLARVQILSYCSPVSSGFASIDYFLVGSRALAAGVEKQFSEKLLVMEGPPGCLDYSCEAKGAPLAERSKLGLGEEELVFINAASCYKISAEALDCWLSLLADVPGSKLVLMPFNPNWASEFPRIAFQEAIATGCLKHGVARERVVIAEAVGTRAEVKAIQALADLYLDVFPFSGSLSVIDPLEVGVPVVTCEGHTFRGNFAPAILREVGFPDLVAPNVEKYRDLALTLARDSSLRRSIGEAIRARMATPQAVTNSEVYGRELSRVLWQVLSNSGG